jgi:hypothetical protein
MSSPIISRAVPARNRAPFIVATLPTKNPRIITMPAIERPDPTPPAMAIRRPTRDQGRALELLGHAIQYLIDENRHCNRGDARNSLAVRTLMNMNRTIFYECEPVLPWPVRLRQWMTSFCAA